MEWIVDLLWVLILGMALLIFVGKGDWLIAGYNTASKEEKAKYDVKRLRLVMGVLLALIAGWLLLFEKLMALVGSVVCSSIVIVPALVAVVLANTWAKKR